jgi:uncharacterized protein (UPF0335 family)
MKELLKKYENDLEKTVKQIELFNRQKKTIDDNLKKMAAMANKQSGAIEALNKLMEMPKKDGDSIE